MPLEALAQTPAKKLFGSKPLPAQLQPAAHGFYTKGCLSGGIAIPVDGPHWQAMRLSRNRRWGHPDLIKAVEDLSYRAKQDGWNGLLVGDISQPRGGPMLTGHRSHQVGLDADIWFNPMPDRRMTYQERENISAVSVLKQGSVYVDEARWTRGHTMVLYHAATTPNVERVLVHPGVKKHLCETVRGNRSWLNKIRPTWGHHYHFHIRMGCPKGSPNCKRQNATGSKTGCDDGSLDWWFDVEFAPKKKSPKPAAPAKKRRELALKDLPGACQAVLGAPSPSLEAATHQPINTAFAAPEIKLPAYSAARVLSGKPIEQSKTGNASTVNTVQQLTADVAIPTPRPR
ncbi:MAG: penicillin-insensitive murein endopeptidase [Pseudomonadota bacterium]